MRDESAVIRGPVASSRAAPRTGCRPRSPRASPRVFRGGCERHLFSAASRVGTRRNVAPPTPINCVPNRGDETRKTTGRTRRVRPQGRAAAPCAPRSAARHVHPHCVAPVNVRQTAPFDSDHPRSPGARLRVHCARASSTLLRDRPRRGHARDARVLPPPRPRNDAPGDARLQRRRAPPPPPPLAADSSSCAL